MNINFKQIMLAFATFAMIGCSVEQKPVEKNLPDFIHGMYTISRSHQTLDEIKQADFSNYHFIYTFATPAWNKLDFSASLESILEAATSFDYKQAESEDSGVLTPELIEAVHKQDSKVLLSFHGDGFNPVLEDAAKREKFVKYIMVLIDKHQYDGIDIDWEAGVELNLHATFIHELREGLKVLEKKNRKYYYLTTALGSWQKYSPQLAQQVAKDLDWINVMFYDMGGGFWGKVATHNTPFTEIKQLLKENWSVFNPKQICVGLASYGYIYHGIKPGQKIEGRLEKYGTSISYTKFVDLLNQGWTEEHDASQGVSYYYSPDKSSFLTIENAKTITDKVDWTMKNNYLGVFWWEYHHDRIAPENEEGQDTHYLAGVVTNFLKDK